MVSLSMSLAGHKTFVNMNVYAGLNEYRYISSYCSSKSSSGLSVVITTLEQGVYQLEIGLEGLFRFDESGLLPPSFF